MNVKSKIPIRIAVALFVFLTVLIDAFEFVGRHWRESFPGPKYVEKSGARDSYTEVTFPFRLGHDFSWRYNEVQCLKSVLIHILCGARLAIIRDSSDTRKPMAIRTGDCR